MRWGFLSFIFLSFVISTKITEWKMMIFGDLKRLWNYRLPVTSYKTSRYIESLFHEYRTHFFLLKKTEINTFMYIYKHSSFLWWENSFWGFGMKNYEWKIITMYRKIINHHFKVSRLTGELFIFDNYVNKHLRLF